jgi:hypothetical protein
MGAPAAALASAAVPRVAIVVGPVGGTTPYYKGLADQAAAAARKAGAQVVKVYSPDATWPAVQQALTGASIVVYLGHGNGWPSRYRDALYPPTQDGFGLNPVAGADDTRHQYFGEASIQTLHLAPNAVVVLSHLCYASGNSEPGLPEGSQTDAIQRVDNFAAGFLKAGASAVVAEAGLGPAYYVKSLLAGQGSIERIYGNAPTANGIAPIATASVRTPGYTVHLDPESAGGGYVRSLVSKGGLTADEVRQGAMGSGSTTVDQPPSEPSLVATGVRFSQPAFKGLPVAATKSRLILTFSAGNRRSIPAGAEVSVRWDPLELDAPIAPAAPASDVTPAGGPAGGGSLAPAASPAPAATPAPAGSTSPAGSPSPAASPAPAAPPAPDAPQPAAPEVDLVVSEQLGSVVVPVMAARNSKGLYVDIVFPDAPGLYRLVPMLHTPDGVAYDAATQALVTPVLVRVSPALAAAYGVQPALGVAAGAQAQLPIRILNAGTKRWDKVVTALPTRVADETGVLSRTTTLRATLVATWVSVTGQPVPDAVVAELDDAVMAPGGSSALDLALIAPADPGDYLLLVDVVAPAGALSSGGVRPAIVRVTVGAAPAPTPAPSPNGTPSADGSATSGGAATTGGTVTPAPATPANPSPTATQPAPPASSDTSTGGPKRPD